MSRMGELYTLVSEFVCYLIEWELEDIESIIDVGLRECKDVSSEMAYRQELDSLWKLWDSGEEHYNDVVHQLFQNWWESEESRLDQILERGLDPVAVLYVATLDKEYVRTEEEM